jgi:hypothetical protein
MTTKKTYECDLCHQGILRYSSGRKVGGEGFGIRWCSVGKAPNFEDVNFLPLHDTEHHICSVCLWQLLETVKRHNIFLEALK